MHHLKLLPLHCDSQYLEVCLGVAAVHGSDANFRSQLAYLFWLEIHYQGVPPLACRARIEVS
jgi:hypothetical protein